MKMKHSVRRDRTGAVLDAARALAGQRASVGVAGDAGRIARIHEFGATIPVSERMRGFLAADLGMHLRAETARIVIPERSFLRAGFDACRGEVRRGGRPLLARAIGGMLAPRRAVLWHGELLAEGVRRYALGLRQPGNAPATVAAKGRDDPLVDTGGMVGAIEVVVSR